MRVNQAIFGELNGGHALKAQTGCEQLALEITERLDLPDTAPFGVSWSPYVSGFPCRDHYILARTLADTGAVRSGMVLSHALIVPISEISRIGNLGPLFGKLMTSISQPIELIAFDENIETGVPPVASDLVPAANALAAQGTDPVVRLGVDAFEELVASLWWNLWPGMRRAFSFRLSFGPHDVFENPKPNLVCTPLALAARWRGYRIIDKSATETANSMTAAVLSGAEDSADLSKFAAEIGSRSLKLRELPLLGHAYRLMKGESDTLDNTIAAVRLVDRLSPDQTEGAAKKTSLLRQLTNHLKSADPQQILLLRNLTLSGFTETTTVWEAVARWVSTAVEVDRNDEAMTSIVTEAMVEKDAVDEWRYGIRKGLSTVAKVPSVYFAQAVWRWLVAKPDLADPIFEIFPPQRPVEFQFASVAPPRIGALLADAVKRLALARGWLRLHGAVLSASERPLEAIRMQISVDKDLNDSSGVRLALRSADIHQVLEAAVTLKDERLIGLAAEEVAKNPAVFAKAECTTVGEQSVWAAAIALDEALWQAPAFPRSARDAVLNSYLDDGDCKQSLIAELSGTPLSDLCDFPRRSQLWQRLATGPRNRYLRATATGWLEHSLQGDAPFLPDEEVQTELLSLFDRDPTVFASHVTAGIRIIELIHGFDEDRFLRWLQVILVASRHLSTVEAENLGQLILSRDWRSAAEEILHRVRDQRPDLKPTLVTCSSILSVVARLTLYELTLTSSQKWEALEDVVTQLYGTGPEHDSVWERAGGENSDLLSYGSGRSRWHAALTRVRNGKAPSPKKLLREMLRDYPKNEALRLLSRDRDIFGR
jgi:GTPase-associated protein 1, N-terminal domain type 1/Effector-associated domain 1